MCAFSAVWIASPAGVLVCYGPASCTPGGLCCSKARHDHTSEQTAASAMPYQAILSALRSATSRPPATAQVCCSCRRAACNQTRKQSSTTPVLLIRLLVVQVHTSVLVCVQTSSIHHARQAMLKTRHYSSQQCAASAMPHSAEKSAAAVVWYSFVRQGTSRN